MHIAINAMFWEQPNVGSGQYLHGLIGALAAVAPQQRYTLFVPRSPEFDRPAALPGALTFLSLPTPFDGRNRNLAKLWFEQVAVPRAAARIGADLLHVPYFAAPLCSRVPVVVSMLDIIPLLLPEYRGRALVRGYMRLVSRAARRAAAVLAISHATRDDLVQHLHIAPDSIVVSPLAPLPRYHAVDRAQARAEVTRRFNLPTPYVYYVGGLDARKNVVTLIRAFARMRHAGGPDATLVIAGNAFNDDPVLFPDIDRVIAEQQIGDGVRRITASVADNPLLYAAATLFAFPSRYEGFGLGPLEAMACGTPCIVSNSSSLPEVVGQAALQVAPDDLPGWTAALWRVLADPALRADLTERGYERVRHFSYERTARLTLAAYERALQRPDRPKR